MLNSYCNKLDFLIGYLHLFNHNNKNFLFSNINF